MVIRLMNIEMIHLSKDKIYNNLEMGKRFAILIFVIAKKSY